jgi:ATP-dependent DNA helicase RecQ
MNKTVLVISPLLALMNQQVDKLKEQGIKALALNSSTHSSVQKQYTELKNFFKKQEAGFIYLSPEKVFLDGFLEYVLNKHHSQIGLVVIDEAHCVSQWGYNFRPSYKLIPSFLKNIFGPHTTPPLLCITATLGKNDLEEVKTDFNISDANIITSDSLVRDNIEIKIEDKFKDNKEKAEKLAEILTGYDGEKAIVYTHIKRRDYGTRKMAENFKAQGFNCKPFDADLDGKVKDTILEEFEEGKVKIVFATSAFGMGIDIPDIRVVVHYLLPESIEQFYQEIGRAGRDGKPAYGYLLYTQANFNVREDLIDTGLITTETIKKTYEERILSRTFKFNDPFSYCMFNLSDSKDDNTEFIIFFYMLKAGWISIVGKGVVTIDCFEEVTPVKRFQLYKSKSVTYSSAKISKELALPMADLCKHLFEDYNKGDLKLVKSPTKCLYYKINRELTEADFELIHQEIKTRNEQRKEGFLKLKQLVEENKDNPTEIIKQYLTART